MTPIRTDPPRLNQWGNAPEMQAALDADVEYLARTGRFGHAYARFCTKLIKAAQLKEARERAEREAAANRSRLDQNAARKREVRAQDRQRR